MKIEKSDLPPGIDPNDRMVISDIKERSALKAQASISISSSESVQKKKSAYKDFDRDVLPPDYRVEPIRDAKAMTAIEHARKLAYPNHLRNAKNSAMKSQKQEAMRQMQVRPKQELNQSPGGRQHARLGRQHRFGRSAESELRDFGSGGESDMYQGPIYGYLPNSNVFGQ